MKKDIHFFCRALCCIICRDTKKGAFTALLFETVLLCAGSWCYTGSFGLPEWTLSRTTASGTRMRV